MPREVRVRLFSTAREAIGRSELRWPLPDGPRTVGDLARELAEAHPALRAILPTCRFVVNGEYVPRSARLTPGDELALHPPYSGG